MLTGERGGPERQNEAPTGARRSRDIRGGLFDVTAVLAVLVLLALGALNLDAVSGRPLAVHQLALAAGGLLLFLVLRRVRVEWLVPFGWVCYSVAVAFLVAVQVGGVGANGARRWLAIGTVTFQPSELAKLGLLLVLADVLGSDGVSLRRFTLAILLALVPIGFTVLEPDLSTATLLVALTLAMLILSRAPLRFLLPLFGGAAVVTPLAVGLLRPYQLSRLHSFLTGSQSAAGPGWAIQQAHVALASGRLLGQSRTPMHRLLALYLPSQHTDLALASLVEQWGLIAGAIAVVAAVIVVWRVALASRVARTRRGTLVGAGLAALFGIETVVAVGGNLGVLPLAGVPFPLVSLGGTAAAVHLAALGLVLGARRDGVHRRLWAPPRWLNPRPRLARFIAFGTSGALVAFSVYGWQLQAAQGASLRHTGQVQMSRCIRLPAARGVITDRHGETLAVTVGQDNIEAVPALLLRQPDRLARLASLIPLPISQLRQILTGAGNSLTVRVAEVPASVGNGIAAARFPDVFVVPSPKRIYPHGALLAPLLGFVGIATPQDAQRWPNLPLGEFVGRSGIEQEYDSLVRGVDGQQCMYVDPAGAPVTLGQRQDPVPGANLRLSIDIGLQQELTDDLAAALRGDFGGPRGDLGGAVAVDPQTGQVLAMASLPSYDDNLYGPPIDKAALDQAAKAPGNPMLEHATQSVAPPGSTFKIVVAATDVAYPVIPPAEVIPTGGSFTLADHTYNNWGVLGPMSLVPSIAWSNDVYFYKLAWALGPNRISQIGTALGVGQPTGIDLPGENPGYLGNPQSVAKRGGTWYAGSTVILGIGQGYINVTPLQNARWTAALATGSLVTPHLGLGFSAGGGSFIGLPAPAPAPLPFAAALGPVREGMRGAVSYGTAAILSNLPVPAGAKTGSAEDPTNPNGVTDSWLTAAAPIDNPTVVVTSLVRAGGHGATTSGPVVDQAMQYFFAHQAQILAGPPTPQG